MNSESDQHHSQSSYQLPAEQQEQILQELRQKEQEYATDRKDFRINWDKIEFISKNFYKNNNSFQALCQELSLKHENPQVRKKAKEFVDTCREINEEKFKMDDCLQRIEEVQKDLDVKKILIEEAHRQIKKQQTDLEKAKAELEYTQKYYGQICQNFKGEGLIMLTPQEIALYDSKEGVQKLEREVFNFNEQEKEIVSYVQNAFKDNYQSQDTKHKGIEDILNQYKEFMSIKAKSLINEEKKYQELSSQKMKLAAIEKQIQKQERQVDKLKKEKQNLEINKRKLSYIDVGDSVSQVFTQNEMRERARPIQNQTTKDYKVIKETLWYSDYVNYGLWFWAFILVIWLLKESPSEVTV